MSVYKDFLGAIIRWALTGIMATMVTKGIVTQEQADTFTTELVIGIVGLAFTLGWGLWQKIRARVVAKLALQTPASEGMESVKAEAAAMPISQQVRVGMSEGPKTT